MNLALYISCIYEASGGLRWLAHVFWWTENRSSGGKTGVFWRVDAIMSPYLN